MTTVADWHTRALDATGRVVAAIPADRWLARTPCPEWDVRGLVSHLVSGNLWAAELGAGQTIEQVGERLNGDLLGADPAGSAGGALRGVVRAGGRVGVCRSPAHRRADPRLGSGHGHGPGRDTR